MEKDRERERGLVVDAQETERRDAEPLVGSDVAWRRGHCRPEVEDSCDEERFGRRELDVEGPRNEERRDRPRRPGSRG